MKDNETYWTTLFGRMANVYQEPYAAVGRALGTDEDDYKEMFEDIDSKMHFQKDDVVLDIAAGNGLLTRHVIPRVAHVSVLDGSVDQIIQFLKLNRLNKATRQPCPGYHRGYSIARNVNRIAKNRTQDETVKILTALYSGEELLFALGWLKETIPQPR